MTNLYFEDLLRVSPSARFRLEVRSPDNEGRSSKWERPFQMGFEYALYETGKDAAVYRRPQAEGSPTGAFVADAGWAVIRTRSHTKSTLFVLDPTGLKQAEIDVLPEVFGPAGKHHVSITSAGPLWAGGLREHEVVTEGGRRLYCALTKRNHRFGLDAESGALLTEAELPLSEVLEAERAAVERSIERAKAALPQLIELGDRGRDDALMATLSDVRSAVRVAALHEQRGLAPDLLQLEPISRQSSETSFAALNRADGLVDSPTLAASTWRIAARGFRIDLQLALRRLGRPPAGLAPYLIYKNTEPEERLELPQGGPERPARLAGVEAGDSVRAVLERGGVPDTWFVRYDKKARRSRACWDYDLFKEGRFQTLRLELDPKDKGRVAEVSRHDDPPWLTPKEPSGDELLVALLFRPKTVQARYRSGPCGVGSTAS